MALLPKIEIGNRRGSNGGKREVDHLLIALRRTFEAAKILGGLLDSSFLQCHSLRSR